MNNVIRFVVQPIKKADATISSYDPEKDFIPLGLTRPIGSATRAKVEEVKADAPVANFDDDEP